MPRRIAGDVGFPGFVWSDGEQREGQQEEAEVEHCLRAGLQQRRGEMRIRVATEQQRLEEEEARRPHARTPAEPREDVFTDERLDLEEEESTGENAEGEGEHEGREKRRSGASERATNAGTAPDAQGGRVVRKICRGWSQGSSQSGPTANSLYLASVESRSLEGDINPYRSSCSNSLNAQRVYFAQMLGSSCLQAGVEPCAGIARRCRRKTRFQIPELG